MAKYIPIGDPMNQSEESAIRTLRDTLPDHFVVIGNFELHLPNRATTFEYDAVVIGEYGLYAVEVKGWTGDVRGDIRRWYLDWGRVQNPFILTERKAKALRSFVGRILGKDLPPDIFCKAVVMLPSGASVKVDDPRVGRIVQPSTTYDFFVNEDEIRERGPGALLDEELRGRIRDALIPLATPSARLPPIADYEVIGELDTDGKPYMEFVARHRLLRSRSRVRLKLYSLDPLAEHDLRTREYERVLRDIEALTQLAANPYIASAYEVIRDQEDELNFYLASEWVGPNTLLDYIQETDCRDVERFDDCRELGAHLLRAVQFMHDQGIVHRNLHPGVIHLTDHGWTGVPFKICDFDHARVVQLPSIEGNFEQLGTEGYMAPELWQSDTYDHRVDIFSVGVILFELLTGERLYENLSDMLAHDATWARRRSALPAGAGRDVLDIVLCADPDERPNDLQAVLEMFPVQRSPS